MIANCPTSNRALISVIIPVHDGARFLAEALSSAFAQTYSPFEVIVVDDGSTDNSRRIAGMFRDVRLIEQVHQGAATARNSGIAAARGNVLAFLDHDDFWLPNKLEFQIDHLERNARADGVLGRFQNFIEPGVELPEGLDTKSFLRDSVGAMPTLSALLLHRTSFDRVGPFDPTLETGEDLDWFLRAKEAGTYLEMIPLVLVYRRLHDANLSYRTRRNHSDLLRLLRASIGRKKA